MYNLKTFMSHLYNELPEQFLERLKKIIPEKDLEKVLLSFTKKRASTFRTNTLKISSKKLEQELI